MEQKIKRSVAEFCVLGLQRVFCFGSIRLGDSFINPRNFLNALAPFYLNNAFKLSTINTYKGFGCHM